MKKDSTRKTIDWEAVEREYRVGVRSLRDIGAQYGCSEGMIRKKAKAQTWDRDLSAKIAAKTEALVRKEEVRKEVRSEGEPTERTLVAVSAQMMTDAILNERADVRRARSIVNKLWAQVEAEVDQSDEFERLGAMLRSEDEFGQDKLNDMYMAAISLPQKVKSVKLLADAIKVLIELERKILRIDTMPDPDPNEAARKAVADAGRAVAGGIDAAMKELAEKVKAAKAV